MEGQVRLGWVCSEFPRRERGPAQADGGGSLSVHTTWVQNRIPRMPSPRMSLRGGSIWGGGSDTRPLRQLSRERGQESPGQGYFPPSAKGVVVVVLCGAVLSARGQQPNSRGLRGSCLWGQGQRPLIILGNRSPRWHTHCPVPLPRAAAQR